MWRSGTALVAAGILAVCVPAHAQGDARSRPALGPVGVSPVRDERREPEAIAALRAVIDAGDVGGRLYYRGGPCWLEDLASYSVPMPPLRLHRPPVGAAPLAAARAIFRDEPGAVVTGGRQGLIRVGIGAVPDALLKTRISLTLESHDRYHPLAALLAIMHTPAVESATRRLNMRRSSGYIHFLSALGGKPAMPALIDGISLDQALDLVATTFGVLVVYAVCEDGRRFDMNVIGY